MSSTDSYLSLFSALTTIAPIGVFTLFLLGLIRMAPIIAMAPFFGSKVPAPIKVGILIALTAVLLPHLALTSHGILEFNATYIVLCIKEFFVGVILAFFASAPFYMAESAGILIDFLRGSSALQVTDPSTQEQTSSIGVLYNYVLIAMFYELNGVFYFLSALFDSYTIIPPDSWLSPLLFSANHPFWNESWGLVSKIFAVGIQLAAPSILAILMTEVFLGIANRLAPQVQIVFLGMSLKSLVGLIVLWAAWFFILQQMSRQALSWTLNLPKIMHLFQL